jgi:hypothetical protein
VAAAKSVGSAETHNSTVIKTHSVKDITEVGSSLSRVRETSIRRAIRPVRGIEAPQTVRYLGTSKELDRTRTSISPNISNGQFRVSGRNWLQKILQVSGVDDLTTYLNNAQTSVGRVSGLWFEAHSRTITAA